MNRIDWAYGFIIGIAAAVLGSFIFVRAFTEYDFLEGVAILQSQENLGRLIKLGALLNLGIFFIMLKLKKDNMAKGVIVATVFLWILTFFV
jgi:hypothetical protein